MAAPPCYLPVATGAPESASTVGAGHYGFSMNGEGPSLDLIATVGPPSNYMPPHIPPPMQ
ncbi:MAG TPA: hypothetical protein VF403_19645 [Kofleriaceae bacterium]